MKWTIKFFLTCTFLCGIFSIRSFAGTDFFALPDSLIAVGKIRDARLELEKIVFFSSNENLNRDALLRISDCYRDEKNFSKMAETLGRIFLPGQPDSLVFQIRYKKALAFYLSENPSRAIFELQSMTRFLDEKEKAARIRFLSALCFCNLRKWGESKQEALEYFALVAADTARYTICVNRADVLFSKKNIPKTLSKLTAKHLSSFIPGSGQIYAGKPFEGIFSLAIHGALLYFGVSQFLDKFYFTGYTAGFGLLERIYTGNLQRVQNLVEETNNKRFDRFYNEYLELLAFASE
jgi:TM2 domain-containing membrane protein YozV